MSTSGRTPPDKVRMDAADTLTFVGPWVESTPLFFLTDPTLDPYERAVFGALWAWLKRQDRQDDSMPGIAEIKRLANIRSRERVVQSLITLRLTRWISLHSRVRDAQGHHRVNAYALNPEPLSLAETLAIDDSYMQFLNDTASHRREKIRNLANHLLVMIAETLNQGRDPLQPPTMAEQIECRQQASEALVSAATAKHFFQNGATVKTQVRLTYSDDPVDKLKEMAENHPSTFNVPGSEAENVQVRLTYPDEKKVSGRTICSSSSNLIKNTTTTPPTPPTDYAWPEFWDDNLKSLLLLPLAGIPAAEHQDWIDELAGQVRARRKTHDPIRTPAVYFQAICKRYLAGEAQLTDYAIQERTRREAQARVAAARAAQATTQVIPIQAPAKPPVDKAVAQQHIQSLTQALKRGGVS